jgi:hypothetical protein
MIRREVLVKCQVMNPAQKIDYTFIAAQPRNHPLGLRVDATHQRHLMVPLYDVILVDADGVYPEGSEGIFSLRNAKKVPEVRPDPKLRVINQNLVLDIRRAPDIREAGV